MQSHYFWLQYTNVLDINNFPDALCMPLGASEWLVKGSGEAPETLTQVAPS